MAVTGRGVPRNAIVTSSIIGFLCVIAAAIWPKTVFAFLLNSSGAIFLVLVQMMWVEETRTQIILSLMSWAIVLALFFVNRAIIARRPVLPDVVPTGEASRILVIANETVGASELIDELRRIDAAGKASYQVVVPASPVETGTAATHGAVSVWEATIEAATARLKRTLGILREAGLEADGKLGDYRPLHAMEQAVESFSPDRIVISTLPTSESVWQRFDVVDRAKAFGLPVTHIEAHSMQGAT